MATSPQQSDPFETTMRALLPAAAALAVLSAPLTAHAQYTNFMSYSLYGCNHSYPYTTSVACLMGTVQIGYAPGAGNDLTFSSVQYVTAPPAGFPSYVPFYGGQLQSATLTFVGSRTFDLLSLPFSQCVYTPAGAPAGFHTGCTFASNVVGHIAGGPLVLTGANVSVLEDEGYDDDAGNPVTGVRQFQAQVIASGSLLAPEPTTVLLVGGGLLSLAGIRRRKPN